jgi:hypothetical protein
MAMDAEAWAFVETLFAATTAHPAAAWLSPTVIWPAKG